MSYVTGNTIRTLREKNGITQKELAEIISVSDKTISKWETNKGLPDIGIIEELAKALRVSLSELFTGDLKTNENVSGNMKKIQFVNCNNKLNIDNKKFISRSRPSIDTIQFIFEDLIRCAVIQDLAR